MDIEKIINEMTLEEKAGLCSGLDFWHLKGVERLGVPSIMLTDGPHGLRKQIGESDMMGINESVTSVCFPTASALAASFDRDVLRTVGETIGSECRALDVAVLLGPGLNIKRHPICGRNFEYLSEDPYLSSRLGAALIKGVQSKGVGTSVKHFLANNQEYERMSSNSVVDERTLREIYLASFEYAVKEAKPATVMCSYNAINGTFAAENKEMLTDVLRDEWGYEGAVVTDWGAGKGRVDCLKAGLDIQMPGGDPTPDAAIVEAVRNGSLDEAVLDTAVRRILKLIDRVTLDDGREFSFDYKGDHRKSASIAAECAVLLQNKDNVLPMNATDRVLFVGEYADAPRYQGSGSSHINSFKVTSALEAAKENGNNNINYAKGFSDDASGDNDALLNEAIEKAADAEIIVVFAGLPAAMESEGIDRKTLSMPDYQNRLIEELSHMGKKLIVVLHNGSPIEMPWIDCTDAVLEMYLGGENVGTATYDLLYGKVNPSGRLAESFPLKLAHNPAYLNYPGSSHNVEYHEGVFVGYRYYDTKEMDVRFPFGHGLSYTTFTYTDMTVDKTDLTDEEELTVTVTVKNTGNVTGKEVVQLYVADRKCDVPRPVHELKGFEKISLAPQEEKQVKFTLDKRAFAYWNTILQDWYVESGEFVIEAGSSSRDIRQQKTVTVTTDVEIPCTYNQYSTVGEIMKSKKGAQVLGAILAPMMAAQDNSAVATAMGDGAEDVMESMFNGMLLSGLVTFGVLKAEQLQEILDRINE